MSTLFHRASAVQCFFCQSFVFPRNAKSFKCSSCDCWNRYNEKGEILSDEPAMHEEHLNSRSFAKRGSPSKDRLPNQHGPGPFCHSCQTNQMLLLNLLSNYLPDPDSPDYQSRLEMLPAYRESLHVRYPPVCETCLPLVEDEIRRKEHMARVHALGGWLSKGKERQHQVSNEIQKEKAIAVDHTLFWWRVRGCLWVTSYLISIIGNLSASYGYGPFKVLSFLRPVLPLVVVVSLLWTAWDPTYASFRKAQQQSRDVRIQGRHRYNAFQILVWSSRLICSVLLSVLWFRPEHETSRRLTENHVFFLALLSIEIISLIGSAAVLRIYRPPSIRLVDTTSHRIDKSRSATPAPQSATSMPMGPSSRFPAVISENDMLSTLSLSSKPVISNSRPVFGQPSLQGSRPRVAKELEGDEMDWTPTDPESSSTSFGNVKRTADSLTSSSEVEKWLRPQKFFAPEKPTGLEGLLEHAQIRDEPMAVDVLEAKGIPEVWYLFTNHLRRWGAFYALGMAILVVSTTYPVKINWLRQMAP